MHNLRLSLLSLALLSSACTPLANYFLLHPSHHPIARRGVAVEFPARSPELKDRALTLFYDEIGTGTGAPDVMVLALSGSEKRAEEMTRHAHSSLGPLLQNRGKVGLYVLQYPGFGNDKGDAALGLIPPAAQDALEFLGERANQEGKATPIIVYGFSLGAAAAIGLGAKNPGRIQGLVLEKTPDFKSIVMKHHGWWNLWMLAAPIAQGVPDGLSALARAQEVTTIPALFIEGTKDQDAPPAIGTQVYNAFGSLKQKVICDCSHQDMLTDQNTPYLKHGIAWLDGLLDGTSTTSATTY